MGAWANLGWVSSFVSDGYQIGFISFSSHCTLPRAALLLAPWRPILRHRRTFLIPKSHHRFLLTRIHFTLHVSKNFQTHLQAQRPSYLHIVHLLYNLSHKPKTFTISLAPLIIRIHLYSFTFTTRRRLTRTDLFCPRLCINRVLCAWRNRVGLSRPSLLSVFFSFLGLTYEILGGGYLRSSGGVSILNRFCRVRLVCLGVYAVSVTPLVPGLRSLRRWWCRVVY